MCLCIYVKNIYIYIYINKKNEKERKISTCVYVHSILHCWACMLIFEGHCIEYVCWWEFVCELPETLHSLYSFRLMFWERDEWPSPRDSESLFYPSLRSLLMWFHSMSDLSWLLLLFVFFASASSSFLLLIHHPHLTPCHSLTSLLLFPVWHFTCIILTHPAIRSFFFITLLLTSRSCWAHSGPWLMSFSVHIAFYTWGHEFWSLGI